MAADGRVTIGQLIVQDNCKKITKLSDGALFALAGDDQLEKPLIEWLEEADGGIMPPQGKDFTAILVDTSGNLSVFIGAGDRFVPWEGMRYRGLRVGVLTWPTELWRWALRLTKLWPPQSIET
jgi:hypothetical protein